jgi:hypothetical protein
MRNGALSVKCVNVRLVFHGAILSERGDFGRSWQNQDTLATEPRIPHRPKPVVLKRSLNRPGCDEIALELHLC